MRIKPRYRLLALWTLESLLFSMAYILYITFSFFSVFTQICFNDFRIYMLKLKFTMEIF